MSTNSLVWNFVAKDKASKTIDRMGSRMGGLGARIAKGLKAGAIALGALGAAGAVMGVKTAAALEQADVGFTTLLGSSKAAGKWIKELTEFAKSTPFELPGLIDSSRLLIGVGKNTKETKDILQAFGDTAGAVGVGQENFSRIMLAVSQSISAGKIKLGDMNQLMNNGIPIWKLMSEAMGKPVPELQKLISHGKLMTDDVLPKLLAQMEKDYGGAMTRQSQTLTGVWSNLMDTLNVGLANVIKPLMPVLKEGLKGAISVVGTALSALPGAIETAMTGFDTFRNFIKTKVAPTIKKELAKIGDNLPSIDFSSLATGLMEQAKTWAGSIITGIQTGMDTGNWQGLGESIGRGIAEAANNLGKWLGRITANLGAQLSKIDFIGIGIALGKQVPTMLLGLVIGILNFDIVGLLKGLGKHWQDAIWAVLAVAFVPVKWIAKLANLLRKIPFVGRMLAWGVEIFAKFARGLKDGAWNALKFLGRSFMDGFRRVFPSVGKRFAQELSILPTRIGLLAIDLRARAWAMVRGIGNGIKSGISWVVAKIGELIARMLRPFINIAKWLLRPGREMLNGLWSGAKAVWTSVNTWIASIGGRIVQKFVNAKNWLLGSGRSLIGGLKQGILDGFAKVGEWAKTIKDKIVSAIKSVFGIHSPSTVFAGLGAQMLKGLVVGLSSTNPSAIIKSVFGSMPKALGHIVSQGLVAISSLPKKALSALQKLGGVFSGMFGGNTGGGGGVGRWSRLVMAALQYMGQPLSLVHTVLRRMNQESGGNPRAINLWDINAKRGDPSRGLMQTIMGTFRAYHMPGTSWDIYDPWANVLASMNYALHRYGSLAAAYNRPGGYDSGGMLMPGYTLAYNGTGKPEGIFTAGQMAAMGGVSIAQGAVQLTINGDVSPRTVAAVEKALGDAFSDLLVEIRTGARR